MMSPNLVSTEKTEAEFPAQSHAMVLIVDDDMSVRSVAERLLKRDGYQTICVENGCDALAVLRQQPVDLLLTDLQMPEMSGQELSATARQMCPNLKVAYLTGYSNRLFEQRLTLGISETYVAKPYTAAMLREAVSLLLYDHLSPPAMTNAGFSQPLTA